MAKAKRTYKLTLTHCEWELILVALHNIDAGQLGETTRNAAHELGKELYDNAQT